MKGLLRNVVSWVLLKKCVFINGKSNYWYTFHIRVQRQSPFSFQYVLTSFLQMARIKELSLNAIKNINHHRLYLIQLGITQVLKHQKRKKKSYCTNMLTKKPFGIIRIKVFRDFRSVFVLTWIKRENGSLICFWHMYTCNSNFSYNLRSSTFKWRSQHIIFLHTFIVWS